MAMQVIVRAAAVMQSSVGPMGALGGFLGFVALLAGDIFFCVIFLRMFFSLFRRYRNYKIFVDTPEIQIGSAALGLVKIRGKAESDQLEPAPFSQSPAASTRQQLRLGRPPATKSIAASGRSSERIWVDPNSYWPMGPAKSRLRPLKSPPTT